MNDAMMGAFSRLPYFDSLMMINANSLCGLTRMLQCRYLGVTSVLCDQKIRRESQSHDVNVRREFAFKARFLDIVEESLKSAKDASGKPFEFYNLAPILPRWVVVGENELDSHIPPLHGSPPFIGDMVFTDLTTKRFLVTQIGSHPVLHAQAKHLANVLYNLATYLGWGPKAVFYCAWGGGHLERPFDFSRIVTGKGPDDWEGLPYIHEGNYSPCFQLSDLVAIDRVVNGLSEGSKRMVTKDREEQGLTTDGQLRKLVRGTTRCLFRSPPGR